MLPPTVPLTRTWVEPKRRMSSPRSGWMAPSERRRFGERHARAERERTIGTVLDRVEPADPSEPDDALEVTQLLGDPEADVGRAGDKRRVGKTLIERGERVEARGRGEEAALVADEEVRIVGEPGERPGALGRRRCEAVGRGSVAGREPCGQDRAIAGAAAEIAGELVAEARGGRGRAGMIGGEQAHHDARRAEAALRAVMVDHRLLHRMQAVALGEVLDRDEFGAVELAKQQDAGVDRLVGELAAAQTREHDRAGAAIALGAAFLRAGRPLLFAQPVENGRARREPVERDLAPPKPEAQRVTGLGLLCRQIHRRSSKRRP